MKENKNELFLKMLPQETERLIIRRCNICDVDMLLKMDHQEETQKFLGGIKNKTREERIAFLKKKVRMLTVCLKDNTPIGFTGLSVDDNNCGKIGYIFDYDYWNNGYCTEACRKLLDIGFNKLNLDKVVADTVTSNNSSKRVLEKLGFKLDRVREDTNFVDYSIKNSEYKNR